MINPKKYIFVFFIFPFFLLISALSILYRAFIDIVLYIKYGKKYGGLLNATDIIWLKDDISKGTINILFMIKFDPKYGDFYECVKKFCYEKVFANPTTLTKLTSVFKEKFGYVFLLQNEYTLEECVQELKDVVKNEEDLQNVLSKYASESLPKNHTTLWDILVCKNSIKWSDNDKECYPVIIRVNHAMTDALHFVYAFMTILKQNDKFNVISRQLMSSVSKPKSENDSTENAVSKICLVLKQLILNLYAMLLTPFVMFESINPRGDVNDLHGKVLSGEKILAWKIENYETITKIKRIKNKVSGGKFGSVLITAIAASFEDYFKKNASYVPENFKIGFSITPIHLLKSTLNPSKEPILTNDITGVFLETPVQWTTNSIIERLENCSKYYNRKTNMARILAHYWCQNTLPKYIPAKLLDMNKDILDVTMVVSNIPDLPLCQICDNVTVVDTLGWIPHHQKFGLGITVLTYDSNRMELALSVDTALVDSVDKANDILEGICKYIDEMDNALKNI